MSKENIENERELLTMSDAKKRLQLNQSDNMDKKHIRFRGTDNYDENHDRVEGLNLDQQYQHEFDSTDAAKHPVKRNIKLSFVL